MLLDRFVASRHPHLYRGHDLAVARKGAHAASRRSDLSVVSGSNARRRLPIARAEANFSLLVPAVERAAELLDRGFLREAQQALDRADLPPLSPDGALLMAKLARRFDIAVPQLPIRSAPRRWSSGDIDWFARQYDRQFHAARNLAHAFQRGAWVAEEHPRWPQGAPDSQGGRFTDVDDAEQGDGDSPDAANPKSGRAPGGSRDVPVRLPDGPRMAELGHLLEQIANARPEDEAELRAARGEDVVESEKILQRELEIVVPKGSISPVQKQVLDDLINKYQRKSFIINVNEF